MKNSGQVLLIGLLSLSVFACSKGNPDPDYERAVRRKGIEALKDARRPEMQMEIGHLFGTKGSTFCITSTIPHEVTLLHSSSGAFQSLYPLLKQYADEHPGDLSNESERLYFVSGNAVIWSAEVYPGTYNVEFEGGRGCYRLATDLVIRNSDPFGPLIVRFPTNE